jgi:hypothetical protein
MCLKRHGDRAGTPGQSRGRWHLNEDDAIAALDAERLQAASVADEVRELPVYHRTVRRQSCLGFLRDFGLELHPAGDGHSG